MLAWNIGPVDHRWNQHGLGGDKVEGKCRNLHPGPTSLLLWRGKGKPWLRSEARKPCAIDHLWAPYDLSRSLPHQLFLSKFERCGVEDEEGHVGRSLWPSSIDHVIGRGTVAINA